MKNAWSQGVPVAVPDKIFGLAHFLDFIDRGHSLRSLYPPLAALPSLPLWNPPAAHSEPRQSLNSGRPSFRGDPPRFLYGASQLPDKSEFICTGCPRHPQQRGKNEEENHFKKASGSTALPLQLTPKCRWSPMAFSISAVLPTLPMVCPAVTVSPALTLTSWERLL